MALHDFNEYELNIIMLRSMRNVPFDKLDDGESGLR
jgi:hypothetical protein